MTPAAPGTVKVTSIAATPPWIQASVIFMACSADSALITATSTPSTIFCNTAYFGNKLNHPLRLILYRFTFKCIPSLSLQDAALSLRPYRMLPYRCFATAIAFLDVFLNTPASLQDAALSLPLSSPRCRLGLQLECKSVLRAEWMTRFSRIVSHK